MFLHCPLPPVCFNVEGAVRGKPDPTGIALNDKGVVLCLCSKGVAVRDSNEAEVLAIMEALRIYSRSFQLDSEE